ncbi:MAG: hypothetical protein AB7L91_18245 [Dehalococcoidia bacterium]
MTSSATRHPHRRPGAPASREIGDLIARRRETDARRPGGLDAVEPAARGVGGQGSNR